MFDVEVHPVRSPTTATLLAATVVVAACGSGGTTTAPTGDGSDPAAVTTEAGPSPPATLRTTTTSVPTTADPLVAVEQAFHDQWDAYLDVLEAPDITDPLIDEHFTGRAREHLADRVSEFLAEGKVAVRPEDPDELVPRIVGMRLESPTVAHVFECTVDGVRIIDARTGEVRNGTVITLEARNTFHLVDGRWKLANLVAGVEPGEPSCDDR